MALMPALVLLAACLPTASPAQDDFVETIQPLLESRCLRCHGGAATKGGLSLATLDAARKGGTTGPAVVPGKPDESWLLDMVAGDEPSMPRGGDPLSAEEVDALRRWIESGAPWPQGLTLAERRDESPWWAIQPLRRPPLPAVSDPAWMRTPIDAFILAKLGASGLRPRPEADRLTLIRRLTFDLHGLPPSPGEVEAFLDDQSPDAYERLVDRLLDSPRYGERWGRHWLDVVHYADTHGYDKDKRRDHAWPYRDYVIRSLNEDKPYSQFVLEQLAGDVLRPGDPEGVIATGFIAAGPWDFVGHVELREGTVEKEKTRLVDRDDMLASTMSTFTSLTVHCARCHDHKFDPIPQSDYYRLQAVFAGVERGDRPYPMPAAEARRLALQADVAEAERRLAALEGRSEALSGPVLAKLDAERANLRARLDASPTPAGEPGSPTNGYHSAIHPGEPDATAWVQVDLGRSLPIDEVRLVPARPTDFPDTPGFGFPQAFRVEISDEPEFKAATPLVEERRPDGLYQADEPMVLRTAGRPARYVRVTATRLWNRPDYQLFALAELEVVSNGANVALGAPVSALDSIESGRWGMRNLVDGFSSRARRPAPDDPDALARHALLARLGDVERERRRSAEESITPEVREALSAARAEVDEARRRLDSEPGTELVYAALPREPRPIHVLNRGEVEQPGALATPGTLACVPGLVPDFPADGPEGHRRAALAYWIADPANMLTWRSIANRIWHHHFGQGLVPTLNDFGRNGATPSHPELLDWLAVEFRDGGQSLKALHRLILTSAAYRQSSDHDPEAARIDGENRLLWRMNRRRLEAEEVRDAVLSVSGSLDARMFGPGFEVFRFVDDHSPTYDHLDPAAILRPEGHRRCVYRFAVRSVPNPFVDCLDGADPNASTPARNETITALQALTLLNDPFMVAQTETLARRLRASSDDPGAQVEAAYRLAFGRRPDAAEREAFVAYIGEHGLAAACRLLFNLNEFVFVD
jgi:hypothetical protein